MRDQAMTSPDERERDDEQRLFRLVDDATDVGWDAELSAPGSDQVDDEVRGLLIQQRQAAALGAIAFLILRQDESLWEAWTRY